MYPLADGRREDAGGATTVPCDEGLVFLHGYEQSHGRPECKEMINLIIMV